MSFYSIAFIANRDTRPLQYADVNNPLQTVFKRVYAYCICDVVKHELRVESLKARIESIKHELKFKSASSNRIHELRARIHDSRLRIREFKNH